MNAYLKDFSQIPFLLLLLLLPLFMMIVNSNLDLFYLPSNPAYERRRPEETLLYKVIQENWLTFLEQAEWTSDKGLPLHSKERLPQGGQP